MKRRTKILSLSILALLSGGCATQRPTASQALAPRRICQVRTTAYTSSEKGGSRNALGTKLSNGKVKSASADWSRWPLGTRFRIVETNEVFQVDDYGSALVGTNTIDLYKTNRLQMRKWGVRNVDIDVLEWGSPERSREVLEPRARNRIAQAMITSLTNSPNEQPDGVAAGF